MHTWTRRLVAGALGLMTTMAATAPASAERPTGPEQVVLRASTGGGYVPQDVALAQVPELTVYGDGRVVFLGPTTLEYPGTALPSLRELRLSDEGVDRIVRLARAAELLDRRPPRYGTPGVTDNPSTTVTVNANGKPRSVSVYALGFDDERLSERARANRRRLRRFLDAANTFPRRFVVEREHEYRPTALEVHRIPVDELLASTQHDWPLGPFAVPGSESDPPETPCATFTGTDAATVLEAARRARARDVWNIAGWPAELVFRPLLPGETGCAGGIDRLVHIVVQPNGWGAENARFDAYATTVYRDGRIVVTPSPYGDTRDPSSREVRVPDAELEIIEQAARDAGLVGPPLDYGEIGITDQGNTIVEVTVDDDLHRTVVYALGMEDLGGLTDEQIEAREQLAGFIDVVAEIARN
jgi:hypothetical protein